MGGSEADIRFGAMMLLSVPESGQVEALLIGNKGFLSSLRKKSLTTIMPIHPTKFCILMIIQSVVLS